MCSAVPAYENFYTHIIEVLVGELFADRIEFSFSRTAGEKHTA